MKSPTFTMIACVVALLLPNGPAFAAKPAPYGFWPGYFGAAAINNRWGIWGEAQYRAYDATADLEQLLLRSAVTYNLDAAKTTQLALGYAYVRSEPYISGTELKRVTEEHRLYQQLLLKHRRNRLYLAHRYRVEERFLADNQFRLRFRYNVTANLCLNQKELTKRTVYLSACNEIFLHTDRPVFDRNRLYGGVGYGISKTIRLEAGSMWQMLETATRPQAQVMLLHNFHW